MLGHYPPSRFSRQLGYRQAYYPWWLPTLSIFRWWMLTSIGDPVFESDSVIFGHHPGSLGPVHWLNVIAGQGKWWSLPGEKCFRRWRDFGWRETDCPPRPQRSLCHYLLPLKVSRPEFFRRIFVFHKAQAEDLHFLFRLSGLS